jgi:hypothetical protein
VQSRDHSQSSINLPNNICTNDTASLKPTTIKSSQWVPNLNRYRQRCSQICNTWHSGYRPKYVCRYVDNKRLYNAANAKYFTKTATKKNRFDEEIKSGLNTEDICYHAVQRPLYSCLLSKRDWKGVHFRPHWNSKGVLHAISRAVT